MKIIFGSGTKVGVLSTSYSLENSNFGVL